MTLLPLDPPGVSDFMPMSTVPTASVCNADERVMRYPFKKHGWPAIADCQSYFPSL
jgi:hypothetical protein